MTGEALQAVRGNETPPLALAAMRRAEAGGFTRSSLPEVGRLLATLTAARPGGRIAEAGTGYGVGAAWILSALPDDAALLTCDLDPACAAAALELLGSDPRVTVFRGGWLDYLPDHGPYDLLFLDGGHWKQSVESDGPQAAALMRSGGTVVVDDMTPGGLGGPDPVRAFWLEHPDFWSCEIQTSPSSAALLATRR